ncbi:hypothetical protein ACFVIM_15835 [Streptomyces sp. NPDC057638]|uniref:class III lanthionine synthetase LanKC N-terminal domain-containing protein n=1 Tax=Streptomyces sp. NPDC057638 TaxID=3346190 RepID=UPI0036B0C150
MDPRSKRHRGSQEEPPHSPHGARTAPFDIHGRTLPEGWRRGGTRDGRRYEPPGTRVPPQGWQIHVSATGANAAETARTVWEYAVARRLPVTVTAGPRELARKNTRGADPSGSGGLATLYPAGEPGLARTLEELGGLLHGRPGPSLCDSLRWRGGPLYVRYAATRHRPVHDGAGRTHPGIEDGRGTLVPDTRGPEFRIPEWVTPPAVVRQELGRQPRRGVASFPYGVTHLLRRYRGGAVYAAKEPGTGRRLLVKEAHPYAGVDGDGRDARDRLRHERDVLLRLRGLSCVPDVVDYVTLGEREYLVEEYADGTPLDALDTGPGTAERVYEAVAAAVRAVHRRGLAVGALPPSRVLVRAEGARLRAVLVSFDAVPLDDEPHRVPPVPPERGGPLPGRDGCPGALHDGGPGPLPAGRFALDVSALAALRLTLEAQGRSGPGDGFGVAC